MGLFSGLVKGIFGGGGSRADANNQVDIVNNTAPVINIDLDVLGTAVDEFGNELSDSVNSLTATLGFVVIVGVVIMSVGR